MAIERAVKKIRPADFELSQVQDNLANHLQAITDRLLNAPNRRSIFAGTYSSVGGTMPTSNYPLSLTTNNISRSTFNTTAFGEVMTSPGSVVAIKVFVPTIYTGGTITLTLYKNSNAQTATCVSKGGNAYATFAANTYKYAAGDLLQLCVKASTSNIQTQLFGHLETEEQG